MREYKESSPCLPDSSPPSLLENTTLKMKLFQALPSSSSPGFHSLCLCLTCGIDAGSAAVLTATMQCHSPCLSSRQCNPRPSACRTATSVDMGVTRLIFSASSSQTSEISRYQGNPEGLKTLLESKAGFLAFSMDAEVFQSGKSLSVANLL